MNYCLLVVLAILIICALKGLSRGFVKTLFETCSLIVALILALLISPAFAKSIQANENIMNSLTTKIDSAMNLQALADKLPDTGDFMQEVNLPDVIKDKLVTDEFMDKLDLNTVASTATQALAKAVSEFLAKMIIYVLCFLAVFILAQIALYIVSKTADLIAKLPLLKQVNKLAGLAVGLVQGVLIVWILFALITVISSTAFGQTMFTYINDNAFLSFLYNNNLPLSLITGQVEKLF